MDALSLEKTMDEQSNDGESEAEESIVRYLTTIHNVNPIFQYIHRTYGECFQVVWNGSALRTAFAASRDDIKRAASIDHAYETLNERGTWE